MLNVEIVYITPAVAAAAAPAAAANSSVDSPAAEAPPGGVADSPGIVLIKGPDGIVVTLQLAAGVVAGEEMRRFDKISLADEQGNSTVLEKGCQYTLRRQGSCAAAAAGDTTRAACRH